MVRRSEYMRADLIAKGGARCSDSSTSPLVGVRVRVRARVRVGVRVSVREGMLRDT